MPMPMPMPMPLLSLNEGTLVSRRFNFNISAGSVLINYHCLTWTKPCIGGLQDRMICTEKFIVFTNDRLDDRHNTSGTVTTLHTPNNI